MAEYERIPYTSFLWKLGTTSFRTREFNKKTEWQLRLLDEFWKKPENIGLGWEIAVEGQNDIYEIKNRYYDWLVENGFTVGNEKVKFKAAREKSSGLFDMGFIDNEHRLTEVGYKLLEITDKQEFSEKTVLGITKDSLIYLEQLLKLSDKNTRTIVRPLIVVLYLLAKLNYFSNDEFKYLLPLCNSNESTDFILDSINKLRDNQTSIDKILVSLLFSKDNYKKGLDRFVTEPFSLNMLLSVGMNRKSASYDKPYFALYNELHKVYLEDDISHITKLFDAVMKFNNQSIQIKWKQLLFDTSNSKAIKNNPEEHLEKLPISALLSEENFKIFFFQTMHLFKAKATLEDYLDLNRRYLGLTNCFIFEDNQVKLDVVPKQFFKLSIEKLYEQAYSESKLLFLNSTLEEICPSLKFNESKLIEGLNKELGTKVTSIDEAYDEVDRIRYERLDKIIDDKFTDKKILYLLDSFDSREKDKEINQMVTDNADIPTIFEYVLGIIWFKASGRKGKVLDYLKLSLDANLMPITHAAGGEADIVYEYNETLDYPKHCLLLEATLAEKTNQRRMEMEPVSRHLGSHRLRTPNSNSYCVFATSYLNPNVITDFMSRKFVMYVDPQDPEKIVSDLKIIPLQTKDLRTIIINGIQYKELYKHFSKAFEENHLQHPVSWYEDFVSVDKIGTHDSYSMVADSKSTDYNTPK